MLIVQTDGRGDCTPDLQEAEKALRILTCPAWPFEIRALFQDRPFVRSILCEDVADALAVIPTLGGAKGVYFTINPVGQYAIEDGSVRDRHILSRRWLFVDIDAKRDRDVSASNAELNEAAKVESAIARFLKERGWSDPVRILSGNGYHLHYRVSLPNDRQSQQVVRKVLISLKRRFDSPGAAIDVQVHNAARIVRLPGTWARKGRPTVDRPHRMARILSVPAVIGITDESLVRAFAGADRKVENRLTLTASSRPADAYCLAVLDRECRELASTSEMRNNRANKAAFAVGQLIHYGTYPRDEARRRLLDAAIATGLPWSEAARTIDSGLDAGESDPRYTPDDPRRTPTDADDPTDDADGGGPDDRIIFLGSEVERRPIDWLWADRIPMGLLTGFAGRTSVGKSFVLCDVAARLSTGREFPDGCPSGGPASTLIISEDPADTVLVPRLHELGADLSRIAFLKWAVQGEFTLKSLDVLDRACSQAGDVRLIIIDPPANFLGQVDQHKDAEVRSMLGPLAIWASKRKIAIALISHFNKNNAKDVDAIMRVLGSVAWMTAVRVAHAMAIDPDDPDSRLFLPMKSNVGVMPIGLRYCIVATDTFAKIEWLGDADVSADDAMNGNASGKASDSARRWIIRVFSERSEWLATELHDRRELDGISNNAFYEGLRTFPLDDRPKASKSNMGFDMRTVWSVPANWKHAVPEAAKVDAATTWLEELLSFGELSVDCVIRQGAEAGFDEFAVRSAAERLTVKQNRCNGVFFWSGRQT